MDIFSNNVIYIGRNTTPPEIKIFGKIGESELMHFYEPEPGLFIAESTKVTQRALDAGYQPVSLLLEKKLLHGEAESVVERCKDVPIYVVEDAQELRRIVGFPMTRGVLCAMRRKILPTVETVAADARRVVVLGDVENPANVGTIFRSAAALGADAVLLTGGCGDPLYRRSIRVSMGTVFQIPWAWFDRRWNPHMNQGGIEGSAVGNVDLDVSDKDKSGTSGSTIGNVDLTVTDEDKPETFDSAIGNTGLTISGKDKSEIPSSAAERIAVSGSKTALSPARMKPRKEPVSPDTVKRLKAMGFKTVAMALKDDSINIDDKRLMDEEKLAIILGEEGEGLPSDVIDACDYTVCIPMYHGVDSLNVAAAAAVAIWQLCSKQC